MANGWYGTPDERQRIEAPLILLDPALERFAAKHSLSLTRNHKDVPERSIEWGSDVSCLIQLWVHGAESLGIHVWICASQDRARDRYWKQEFLCKDAPATDLALRISDLLQIAKSRLDEWSARPEQLEFATTTREAASTARDLQADQETTKRGFFFWSLAPFLVLFMVLMPFLGNRNPAAIATCVGMELLAGLLLLGLFNGARFWWAWRGVAAEVFLLCVAYLLITLLGGGLPGIGGGSSMPSVLPPLACLAAFGLPALVFAVTGRLPGLEEEDPDWDDDNFPA